MANMLFANNAATTLASSITNTATSITVASGTGTLFPNPTAGQYFYATLANTAGTVEVVKCTARSTDTLTIVRGQDGTSGVSWVAGDKFELRLVNADLTNLGQLDSANTWAAAQTFTSAATFTANPVLNGLTASQPVFTDASKNATSTGVVDIAHGGTNNGSLGVTAGGVVYTDGSKQMNTGAGTSGQFLTSAAGGAPTWSTLSVAGALLNIQYFTTTTVTVTLTIASPCVVTYTGSAPANGTAIKLTTTGSLPTGLTDGVTYYVINSSGTTSNISLTSGGAAINTSGSQSGVHSVTFGSFIYTPTSGTNSVIVEVVGGGGGGCENTGTISTGGLLTSFGALVSATGGAGVRATNAGGTGVSGDLNLTGGSGTVVAAGGKSSTARCVGGTAPIYCATNAVGTGATFTSVSVNTNAMLYGGGGGAGGTSVTGYSGGGGGYAIKRITSGFTGQTVTVGLGGSSFTGAAGADGICVVWEYK